MKRVISMVIALAMILGLSITTPVTANAETITDATKYSYKITPILTSFTYHLYVETDNPDPTSFRLIDENSAYFTSDDKSEITVPIGDSWDYCDWEDLAPGTYYNSPYRYKDVTYQNNSTGRVAGGYIFTTRGAFSDGGEFTLLQKTASGSSIAKDVFKKTSVKVPCRKLDNVRTYLIHSCTSEGANFFDNMEAVQKRLDEIAIYPREMYDTDKPNERYPYPFLAGSVYKEVDLQRYYEMYETSDDSLLLSHAYPYILDSLGFPGVIASVAKELEPECEISSGVTHAYVDITFEGETRFFGGAGQGGSTPLRSDRTTKTYTFKKDSEMGLNSTVAQYYEKLMYYGSIADADMEEYKDQIAGNTFHQTIAKTGGTWLRIRHEPGFNGKFGETFTYAVPSREGVDIASDVWVDGCYVDAWERIATNEKFSDHPKAGVVKHDVTFSDDEGNSYTQDIIYHYSEENDNWIVDFWFALDYGYFGEEEFPSQFIISKKEAETLAKTGDGKHLPKEGLIYDGTQPPGTPFSIINVSGMSLSKNTIEMTVGEETNIKATVKPSNAYDGRIIWTSSNEDVLTVYGDEDPKSSTLNGQGCTLVANKKGTAVVTATTIDGGYTATCTVTIKEKVVPVAPAVKGGNDSYSGKPKLTWEKVSGASKYEIYRFDSVKNTYLKMYTTTGTSYTNTSAEAGKTYYYKVRAIDSTAALKSPLTASVKITCKYPTPKITGTNDPASGRNKLTWEKVPGATKYEVYRYDSTKKTYVKMYTTTGTGYTNTTAEAGKTYWYRIKALGSVSAATSAFSNYVELTCKYPAPKITGTHDPATGKNKLTWPKVSGATKYEVYRYDSAKKTYVKMHTTTNTNYTNTTAVAGNTYWYRVKAVGSVSAATSAFSEYAELTCKYATPKITGGNDTSSGKCKLTWQKVDGATKYEIYRYDSVKKTYVKMHTTSNTSYINTTAEAGKTYSYKIRAIGTKAAAASNYSNVVKVTCK